MSTETTARPAGLLHPSITELLARVMADVDHVGKDGWNKTQSYNFRGIDAVLNRVGPAFRAYGIVPKPKLKKVTYETIAVGANRTPMTRCTVEVKYRFKGPAGDYEDVVVPGEAFDSGDKATAKAMSVAYRIALIQLLALPTTEPDPDESSYERAPAAVTDQRWLADVRQRIAAATDHDALNVIGADISDHANAGQLATADGDRLRAEFDTRWTALTTQDRPAQHHNGPVEDDWNTASGQQLPPPSPAIPSITTEQLGELARLLKVKRGAVNGDRNAIVSRLVQREVADVKTLSQAEARSIIETLTAEPDHAPLPTVPAPTPAPAGPPARMVTEAQKKMIWGTLNRQQQTKYGGHVVMSRILGREITSTNDLTSEDASKVIEALRTGEIPGPSEPAPPSPPGPNANGEGISEMDVLYQIIDDAHTDVEFDQARAEIEREHAEGGITGDQLAALQAHWADVRRERQVPMEVH